MGETIAEGLGGRGNSDVVTGAGRGNGVVFGIHEC
jgi:hypothetical protein